MNDKSLKNLSALDDSNLNTLILEIAAALGADGKAVSSLTQNPSRVRALLGTMSDADIEKLINKAGEDKAHRIYEAIGRRQGDGRQ